MRGSTLCRMHGREHRIGAPVGNQNARKHGAFRQAEIERRKEREVWRRDVLAELKAIDGAARQGV